MIGRAIDDAEAIFRFSLAVWGWAVSGTDDIAWICENPLDRSTPLGRPYWDEQASDLTGRLISNGGPYRRVPDWHALPGVTDLLLRSVAP